LITIALREHATGGLVIEKVMSHLDAPFVTKNPGSNHLPLALSQDEKEKYSEC